MGMENLQKENEPKVDLKVRTVMVSQSTLTDSWILGEKKCSAVDQAKDLCTVMFIKTTLLLFLHFVNIKLFCFKCLSSRLHIPTVSQFVSYLKKAS